MKKKKKIKKVLFWIIILFIIPNIIVDMSLFLIRYRVDSVRLRLLCKTDHQEVLEACREIMRMVDTGEIKPSWYQTRKSLIDDNFDPEVVSKFPQIIRDIEPDLVMLFPAGKGNMALRMYDNKFIEAHFGFHAFSENYDGVFYGNKELIPGLRYYDNKSVKRIEALMQRGKIRLRDEYWPTILFFFGIKPNWASAD